LDFGLTFILPPYISSEAGWFHTPKEKSFSPLQWTFASSPHFSRGWLGTKQMGIGIFLSLYQTTLLPPF
jgi:hypothetical protein